MRLRDSISNDSCASGGMNHVDRPHIPLYHLLYIYIARTTTTTTTTKKKKGEERRRKEKKEEAWCVCVCVCVREMARWLHYQTRQESRIPHLLGSTSPLEKKQVGSSNTIRLGSFSQSSVYVYSSSYFLPYNSSSRVPFSTSWLPPSMLILAL